jgi:superfamily II DNA or RNA helicase
LTRLIYFHLGNKIHEVSGGMLVDDGHICKAEVETIETAFRTEIDGSTEYPRLLSKLTGDPDRNRLIVQTAVREARESRGITLVLSDRKKHCEDLAGLLDHHEIKADVLTGNLSNGNRAAVVERLRAGKVRILVATGQLIGEGFDLPGIESVILATPLKFSGRLIQYIGRALRPAPGKDHARVIDFVDLSVGVLAAGAKSRARTFQKMPGITMKG